MTHQPATAARRWGRRLLGAAVAASTALAGLTIGVLPASAAVPTDHLVAAYDFSTKPADGATVDNTAAGSDLGAATVQNAKDSLWADNALSLTGGSKTGSGSWVRLPDDIVAGAQSATITMEVKADAAMKSDFHFMWNIGNEGANAGNGPYWFTALKCADGRTPLTWVKDGNDTETGASAGSCVASYDEWLSVTSVIDGSTKTATLYINGTQVASGSVNITPAGITDQSYNTIGRSPWPDSLFKGAVSTFRVYDTALDADQITAISEADALLHADELTGAALDGLSVPSEIDDSYVALPTANGVTWTSSDDSVIAANGMVNQPAKGESAVSVTLTATATVRGLVESREFTVTVNPTDKDAAQLLDEAASGYAIPTIMRSGDMIPAAATGTTVTVRDAEGVNVTDGVVTAEGDGAVTGTVTVDIAKDRIAGSVTKTFTVQVLPADQSATIAAYDRNATSVDEANNGDVAYSMHLALQNEDGSYAPYNENYGIFFALGYRSQSLNMNTVDYARSLKDPSLFRMADGTYGVIAVRTNRGTATADDTGSVLIATSDDLLSYDEQADSGNIVDLGETNGVNNPYAVYDSAEQHYLIGWYDDNGVAKHTTFDELNGKDSRHGDVIVGAFATSGVLDATTVDGIDDFRSGATIAVDSATVTALDTRFGRATNTGVSNLNDITVDVDSSLDEVTSQLPSIAELTYSDGSTGSLPIESWDTSAVNLNEAGDYTVTANVKQTEYQIPFAEDRADPSIYKWQWTHLNDDGEEITETKFLMIATNDIYGDCTWQYSSPHMPFRMADTIADLADDPDGSLDANGYNDKEVSLLKAGDKDSEGNAIMHSFWAPEIHEINGRLTVLFMAGYGSVWTNGKAVYMQLKQDADGHDLDPTNPDNWEAPTPIYRDEASSVNGKKDLALDANGNVGMSLDMTYFQDADGQSYYAWQQLGATYIATMDPADPGHVTSTPVRIVSPDYAWNVTIAEGPNVTMRDGKLYMMFSGSAVGKSYTTGLAIADASGADLLDPDSWTVLNYPIQKSGPFNGAMQLGTGHGMWSEDEDGNQIYVFHAYATQNLGSTNATGRDTFVRRVHWAADGMPVFDMSADEEFSGKTLSVTVHVTGEDGGGDTGDTVDKSALEKALAAAEGLSNDDGTYTAESWDAFVAARDAARETYDDPDASQEAVNQAVEALITAQDALAKAGSTDPTDPTDPSGPSGPSDPSSKDDGEDGGTGTGELSSTGAAVTHIALAVAAMMAVALGALAVSRKRRA